MPTIYICISFGILLKHIHNFDGDVDDFGRFLLEKAGQPAPPRIGNAEKKATAKAAKGREVEVIHPKVLPYTTIHD